MWGSWAWAHWSPPRRARPSKSPSPRPLPASRAVASTRAGCLGTGRQCAGAATPMRKLAPTYRRQQSSPMRPPVLRLPRTMLHPRSRTSPPPTRKFLRAALTPAAFSPIAQRGAGATTSMASAQRRPSPALACPPFTAACGQPWPPRGCSSTGCFQASSPAAPPCSARPPLWCAGASPATGSLAWGAWRLGTRGQRRLPFPWAPTRIGRRPLRGGRGRRAFSKAAPAGFSARGQAWAPPPR